MKVIIEGDSMEIARIMVLLASMGNAPEVKEQAPRTPPVWDEPKAENSAGTSKPTDDTQPCPRCGGYPDGSKSQEKPCSACGGLGYIKRPGAKAFAPTAAGVAFAAQETASRPERPEAEIPTREYRVSMPYPKGTDGRYWAECFQQTLKVFPNLPVDHEAMVGWFANAIMAGRDLMEAPLEQMSQRRAKLLEMRDVQGVSGNWNYNSYMHGMYNGVEFALACLDGREPVYRDAPPKFIGEPDESLIQRQAGLDRYNDSRRAAEDVIKRFSFNAAIRPELVKAIENALLAAHNERERERAAKQPQNPKL